MCSQVYETFLNVMGSNITEPPGAPNLSCYRLVDMYTSVTSIPVKDNIEHAMKESDGTLRVLACTTAFGMGVDCKGVKTVLHWGPPNDIKAYIQEVGQGGRDGEKVEARLYCDSTRSRRHEYMAVAQYCTNTNICRRELLLSHFPDKYTKDSHGTCACCDICQTTCQCTACVSP